MNTILNSLSEADKNKSFLTIYKDGADFDIKLSDFTSAISKGSLKLLNGIDLSANLTEVTDSIGTISPLQLSTEAVGLSRTVNLSAGATTPRLFNVAYTINNSGAQTGTLTGLFLNATETALNGITHNLMDLQVGGVSKFKVSNTGVLSNLSSIISTVDIRSPYFQANAGSGYYINTFAWIKSSAIGNILLQDETQTTFNRLQLGGTTSSFPAIKRNGAAIDFRLADDSGYCAINAGSVFSNTGQIQALGSSTLYFGNANNLYDIFAINGSGNTQRVITINSNSIGIGVNSNNASALLQADSTTKGFLMPRMTTTQKNAIVTPATGLMVFDTDLGKLCVFSTTWQTVTSV